jgi:hypothetical protein
MTKDFQKRGLHQHLDLAVQNHVEHISGISFGKYRRACLEFLNVLAMLKEAA